MDRIADYLKYHADSSKAMDIDIQVEAIAWLCCTRYHLTRGQRLWLSFLFAAVCSPAAHVHPCIDRLKQDGFPQDSYVSVREYPFCRLSEKQRFCALTYVCSASLSPPQMRV
ncbi:MAG: hypothetical protein MJ099_05625 [Clostridia bacterium]|nr:hypothetical protein [Clostridia bacterium]